LYLFLKKMTVKKFFFLILLVFIASFINAELRIEITKGSNDPINIAIVPISLSMDISIDSYLHELIANDLEFIGEYKILPPSQMLSFPSSENELYYRDWRLLNIDYLIFGKAESISASKLKNNIEVTYFIYDIAREKRLHKAYIKGSTNDFKSLAHGISDSIYKEITGISGIFSTKILYVDGSDYLNEEYLLRISDFDGGRDKVLVSSNAPIISPTWSPDGQSVAYVSFELGRSNIYVQSILSGKRQLIKPQEGLNSSPDWSSNGKFLAAVLSKNGNSDIYKYHLKKKVWTRLTEHYGIDTEPDWSSNSKRIVFTSNRSGSPQIYEINLSNNKIKRLTFKGNYNARARYLPDGKSIVYVHRNNGVFHIARLHLKSGIMDILTDTPLDESPTISPNGNLIMYATKYDGVSLLAGISVDGETSFFLPSTKGEVREPAWSPFLN
jgi:TolB protein